MRKSVFISVANDDYRDLRAQLRSLLAGKFDVVVEPDFPASTANSVERLDQFLKPCHLVVHLVGTCAGSKPPVNHVEQFLSANPNFLTSIQETEDSQQPLEPHTWTFPQWEAWLAIYRGIDLLVFRVPSLDPNSLQALHLESLKKFVGWIHPLNPDASYDAQVSVAVHGHFESNLSQTQQAEVKQKIDKANARFKSTATVELINGTNIPRKETKDVLTALVRTEKKGVLVVANAGTGKSCILAQVQEELSSQGALTLAHQLDTLPHRLFQFFTGSTISQLHKLHLSANIRTHRK